MKKLFLLLILTFSHASYAADYQTEIDSFFLLLGKGKNSEAVDSLFTTNPKIVKNNPTGIQDIKNGIDAQVTRSGKLESWNKVGEYVVGDYYAYVTYYTAYEYYPVWMEFQFFKSKDGWRIAGFHFSSEISDDIQKRARYEVSKKTEANKRE
jgi:hypothetical protein